MAQVEDLIDFDVIEGQKENIEALPSGRSAKALVQRFSPLNEISPSIAQDANSQKRNEFELELTNIGDSDDPLDIYDRYVRWTLNAYPSASGTSQSQLLPLLERATKAFLKDEGYRNDVRYLKLWLNYIRLFSDAPRENFAYLARHEIGNGLALYYEEFAAWLESAGRFRQAEEIYKTGIERQARPVERMLRKLGEFEQRARARPSDAQEPSSPAIPAVRPALMAKLDPFSAASPSAADPQAADRARAAATSSKKQKMQIFADNSEPEKPFSSAERVNGWENLGSLAERRKENTLSAQPWGGEKMTGSMKQNSGMPKMSIFKDQSSQSKLRSNPAFQAPQEARPQAPTAKNERVFVNVELVYPDPENESEEYCLEELRAASRGWMQRDWQAENMKARSRPDRRRPAMPQVESTTTLIPLTGGNINNEDDLVKGIAQKVALRDENDQDIISRESDREAAKRFRREERANKTRKIKLTQSKTETQTIQTNLDSPRGPRMKRKKSAEPTMTVHTKAATDEVYELFNQSLSEDEEPSDDATSEDSSSEEEDDEDGYTTGGDSTGTGRISGTNSEYGEETAREIDQVEDEQVDTNAPEPTQDDATGWSEFTTSKHMPTTDDDDGGSSEIDIAADAEPSISREADVQSSGEVPKERQIEEDQHEVVTTPTSPEEVLQETHGRYMPMPPEDYHAPTRPYRDSAQVAASRLPFMTPIIEKTESSMGTMSTNKDYFSAKTPCPKVGQRSPIYADAHDEVLSSPFQEDTILQETTRYNAQPLLPPALEQKIKSPPMPGSRALKPQQKKVAEGSKRPIIQDAQCNPMSPEVHETILREMQPPLSSFDGFYDRRSIDCNRKSEISKFCKASVASKSKSMGDKTIAALARPPTLRFDGCKEQYEVKRELGAGAFAPVYLAEVMINEEDGDEEAPASMGRGHFSLKRPKLQAMKMEEPPSAWEFYMLRCAHRRLGVSRPAQSIAQAYEMHLFNDEGYLFEEYRDQGTLLDLVNVVSEHNRIAGAHGAGMDEALAMFFAVELLRVIEALHSKTMIHGDLKADNVLVRFEQPENGEEISSPYARDGSSGWSSKGITLIDFGRGIDMRHFQPNVQFIADWPTTETDCAEMRELRPWTYQADYHGVAAIAHTMLFGKYIETVAEKGGIGAGAAKTYRLREGLKRWWQTEIWGEFFALLLNPGRHLEVENGQKMPIVRGLKAIREKMEVWLEEHGEKGVGLRNQIRKLEGILAAKRKA